MAPQSMSEDILAGLITALARNHLGLFMYHPHDSRRSEGGWPDWVIYGPGGIIFPEIKGDGGTVTEEQACVLVALRTLGLDARLWFPKHWRSGEIAATLRRLRRPRPGIPVPPLERAIAEVGLPAAAAARVRERAGMPGAEQTLLHAVVTVAAARRQLAARARDLG